MKVAVPIGVMFLFGACATEDRASKECKDECPNHGAFLCAEAQPAVVSDDVAYCSPGAAGCLEWKGRSNYTIPRNINAAATPPATCGAVAPMVLRMMARVNQFWGSSMIACTCAGDFPSIGCEANQVVPTGVNFACALNPTRAAFAYPGSGYIYLNALTPDLFLSQTGSDLPLAWILAHEAGHELQGHANQFCTGDHRLVERSADCYAGYFLAWQFCQGNYDANADLAALDVACRIVHPVYAAAGVPDVCRARAGAVEFGTVGYANGFDPQAHCSPANLAAGLR